MDLAPLVGMNESRRAFLWTGALAVPLLLVLPGLATLGMTDTWLEFRRRLAGRPNAS